MPVAQHDIERRGRARRCAAFFLTAQASLRLRCVAICDEIIVPHADYEKIADSIARLGRKRFVR